MDRKNPVSTQIDGCLMEAQKGDLETAGAHEMLLRARNEIERLQKLVDRWAPPRQP